jgi:hypothetical protein
MKKLGLLGLIVALAVGAFALYRFRDTGADRIVVTLVPGPPTPRISPAEAGIDPAAIQLAVDYAGKRNTSALVIGRNGHIAFEKYWGDTTADSSVPPNDFGRVLPALLIGSAMNDRLIRDLDAPISSYLPELADTPAGSDTLRELLADRTKDTHVPTELIALVLERVIKQPYEKIVGERLWKPLGGGGLSFQRNDPVGLRADAANACCGVSASIGDWMRVGELLANDGVFEGNQFGPPRFVQLILKPNHKEPPLFAAADAAWLRGSRMQRLWVVPSLRLVILRAGGEPDESDGWDESMIPDSIIRGTSGWKPGSAGEGVDPNKFAPH